MKRVILGALLSSFVVGHSEGFAAAQRERPAFQPFRSVKRLSTLPVSSDDEVEASITTLYKLDESKEGRAYGLGNEVSSAVQAQAKLISDSTGLFVVLRRAGLEDGKYLCAYVNDTRCFGLYQTVLHLGPLPNIGIEDGLCPDRDSCETELHPPLDETVRKEVAKGGAKIAVVFQFVHPGSGPYEFQFSDDIKGDHVLHTNVLARTRRVIVFATNGKIILDDQEP